jgi:hypothetical protein
MSIEQLNPDSTKFHTCKFRSLEEIEKTIKRCSCQGGDFTTKGYWCEQREIFQVTEEICKDCPVYQHK